MQSKKKKVKLIFEKDSILLEAWLALIDLEWMIESLKEVETLQNRKRFKSLFHIKQTN